MAIDNEQARGLIAQTQLRHGPRRSAKRLRALEMDAVAGAPKIGQVPASTQASPFTPDAGVDQAAVAGPTLVSFETRVPAKLRDAVNKCLTFAYLGANAVADPETDWKGWYRQYFDLLRTTACWIPQGPLIPNEVTESLIGFEVHQALLKVAAKFLGGPTAIAGSLISDAMTALVSDKNAPWLTIFQQESEHERLALPQMSLVAQDDTGVVKLSFMPFILDAEQTVTQVLFFKFTAASQKLQFYYQEHTIDDGGLDTIIPRAEAVEARLTPDDLALIATVPLAHRRRIA